MTAKAAIEAAKKPISERDPIYIVTGFPRSGTSMMMRCLEKGGIEPLVNDDKDSHLKVQKHTGYLPNPHGFYELGRGEEPWYFPAAYGGKAIKMDLRSTALMAPGQRYRIIVMWRDIEAIERSLRKYMGALGSMGVDKPQLRKALNTIEAGRYAEMMSVAILHMRNRKDVEHLVEVDYAKMVEDPKPLFEKLAEEAKWPVDVKKASAVPKAKWNRSGSTA